jgi:hypothetical protein
MVCQPPTWRKKVIEDENKERMTVKEEQGIR